MLNAICMSLFWVAYAKYKKESPTFLNQRLVISMTVLLYTMYPNHPPLLPAPFLQVVPSRAEASPPRVITGYLLL